MLAEQETVIGADDKEGVLPQVQRLQFIHHLTKVVIAHGDQRTVKLANLFLILPARRAAVIRHPSVEFIGSTAILREVFFRYKEWLMGIKTFDLQNQLSRC